MPRSPVTTIIPTDDPRTADFVGLDAFPDVAIHVTEHKTAPAELFGRIVGDPTLLVTDIELATDQKVSGSNPLGRASLTGIRCPYVALKTENYLEEKNPVDGFSHGRRSELFLVRPMKIYGAVINAYSLDKGSPYYGRPGGCRIQYYALAEDAQNFADRVKEFLGRELWQLDSFEIGGELSRELLLQKGDTHHREITDGIQRVEYAQQPNHRLRSNEKKVDHTPA